MMLYEVAIKKRYYALKALDCATLSHESFINHLKELWAMKQEYTELNSQFLVSMWY